MRVCFATFNTNDQVWTQAFYGTDENSQDVYERARNANARTFQREILRYERYETQNIAAAVPSF